MSLWKRQRLDRMLADHFLRSTFYDTAIKLVKSSKIEVKIFLFLILHTFWKAFISRTFSSHVSLDLDNVLSLVKYVSKVVTEMINCSSLYSNRDWWIRMCF